MKTEQSSTRFLLCPRCGRKTRTLVREDTELIRFPLFCPKCRYVCVVTFKKQECQTHQSNSETQSRTKIFRPAECLNASRLLDEG